MFNVSQGWPESVIKEYYKIPQEWSEIISVEEDFSPDKIYKDVHEFEKYVDMLPESLRYPLPVIGIGSQKLPGNCRSKLNQYLGKCRKRLLGDDFHFLQECYGIEKLV